MSTDKEQRQIARFWQRHAHIKARLDSLVVAKGGIKGEHDKTTERGQLQIATNALKFCRVNLCLGDVAGAYDWICSAEEIHDMVLKHYVNPDMMAASKNSAAQAERASKPRASQDVADIIRRLAKREGTVKELWPAFIGDLDAAGLHPVEGANGGNLTVWYESEAGQASMTIGTFRNRIGRARN